MNIHLAYNSLKTRSLPNLKSKCCEFLSEITAENIFPAFLACNFVILIITSTNVYFQSHI